LAGDGLFHPVAFGATLFDRVDLRGGGGGVDDYSFIDSFGFGCVQFNDFEGQGTYAQMDTPNLYHPSFTFKPENLDGGFENVKSRIPAYYVALDGSFGSQNDGDYTKLN